MSDKKLTAEERRALVEQPLPTINVWPSNSRHSGYHSNKDETIRGKRSWTEWQQEITDNLDYSSLEGDE